MSISFSFASRVEPRALLLGGHAGGRLQIDDRIAGWTEERALIRRGHEAGSSWTAAERSAARVVEHDECRQALSSPTQPVGDPRADAREAHADLARLHLVMRLHVVVRSARTPTAGTRSRRRACAMFGNSSDTSMPLCPYFLNLNGLGISGPG